ncbi:MAG: hypothetical protein ACLFR1_09445 [Spirochaetia bacterium]
MNTIPTTFKRIRVPFTVLGGQKYARDAKFSDVLSIVLSNRGGKIFRADVLEELDELGAGEIISVEGPGASYDLESLARRFTSVRFLRFHEHTSLGEQVNIAIQEARNKYVFVLWNDMEIPYTSISSRLMERIIDQDVLCVVPQLQNRKGETVPSIQAPAFFNKNLLRVIPLQPSGEIVPTLFPFDYTGIYQKERFFLTGGYDYSMKTPYWQKMDFGFRSFMWGEKIFCNPGLKVSYTGEIPSEETTPDEAYKMFFLKNLSIRFRGDYGALPYFQFIKYLFKGGSGFISSLREFRAARKWVRINRFRFKQDAKSVTELWEVDKE